MHENLFWYQNGGLLCMKIFFDTETAAFCVWKSFSTPKPFRFRHGNLFCNLVFKKRLGETASWVRMDEDIGKKRWRSTKDVPGMRRVSLHP